MYQTNIGNFKSDIRILNRNSEVKWERFVSIIYFKILPLLMKHGYVLRTLKKSIFGWRPNVKIQFLECQKVVGRCLMVRPRKTHTLSDRENNLRSRELVFKRNSERTQTWSSIENKDDTGHSIVNGNYESWNMVGCSTKWKRRKMQTDKKFDGTMGKYGKKFWQDHSKGFWGKWANRLQVQAETLREEPSKHDHK